MNKHKTLKIVMGIIIIVLLIGLSVLAFYFVKGGKNPIQNIIDGFKNDNAINDNYNGIYEYKEELNGSKFIFNGCNVSSINYYILVINDDFYSFKSSCMGTYPLDEGKTENLSFYENETKTNYKLTYKDHEYSRNPALNTISTNNNISKSIRDIDLDNYSLILNETEFEGNYYKISAKIKNLSSDLFFGFEKLDDNTFDITINGSADTALYKKNIKNYDNLPTFYPFGKTLAVIEPGKTDDNNLFAYKFKAISSNGIIYDLDKMFPIVVNGVTLSTSNSIYVTYNRASRDFTLLVGYDDKMCNKDSKGTNVTYYEFQIKYDFNTGGFKTPEFTKIGYENEGCNYVNRLIGGN